MATETELKLRVPSHEPIRAQLRAVGAEYLSSVVETNTILDHPDGSLRKAGCGFRLRESRHADTGEVECTLTYKGPREPGPLKVREELETLVEDAAAMRAVLQRLGYVMLLRYQKRRESWRLGECRVDLDEPARLGTFVEIEGPGEPAIRGVQNLLQLTSAKVVVRSYVALVEAYCVEHGVLERELRLADEAPSSPPAV
ncbi:MAG: class IV adenylate cyclase [Planctomycetota bacterium]